MLHSIQSRLIIWFVLLAVVIMAVLGIYLANSVRDSRIEDLRTQLENEARITAEASLPYFTGQTGTDQLDALAKRLGEQVGARVTIISRDGEVLGDSLEDPAAMENHAARPEVREALASGFGESTRYSLTLGRQMMYVAVTVNSNGEVLGMARVALPLTQVETSVSEVIAGVVAATAIAAVLIALAAWLIARLTTRPIRELTGAARQISAGEFGHRITANTRDEAGQLAHAFNEMSLKIKEMLATVSEDRARLNSILDNMADGVVLADTEGRIVLTNRAARKLLNVSDEMPEGRPLIEAVREHELNDLLNACLETGREQTARFEMTAPSRFLQVFAIPITGDRPDGVLLLIQDLTELRGLQTMRRDLVGNISHEFRTPLAGLKAMVETLQDGALDDREAASDFLSRIEDEVDRLTQMVNELTELSRIETGRAELKLEPVDLDRLVREAAAQLEAQAGRQQVSIYQEPAGNLPRVRADRGRISQVIVNLIHNAIKFNRPGGSVNIKTGVSGDSVTVEVTDTGTGIAPEDLPHVFERFYRADKSRTGQGSGMGLAIARHIVEAHGGRIEARSEEGRGSTFTFSLPVQPG